MNIPDFIAIPIRALFLLGFLLYIGVLLAAYPFVWFAQVVMDDR